MALCESGVVILPHECDCHGSFDSTSSLAPDYRTSGRGMQQKTSHVFPLALQNPNS